MGKAPAFQFYVRDWLSDPQLRSAATSTKGIWIDLLCFMWEAPERGRLTGLTREHIAKMTGATEQEIDLFLMEAETLNFGTVTHHHKKITLENRRMVREEKKRKANADRQSRHREKQKDLSNAPRNAKVTSPSSSSSSSSKNNTPLPPSSHSEKIRSILPESLPWNLWVEYRKHRRKTKGGMTEHAEELMAKKLTQFASEGYDPVHLVNETIEKGWKAINPEWVYKDNGGKPMKPEKTKIECPRCGQRHEPHVVEREDGKCPACGENLKGGQ